MSSVATSIIILRGILNFRDVQVTGREDVLESMKYGLLNSYLERPHSTRREIFKLLRPSSLRLTALPHSNAPHRTNTET